MKQTPPQMDLWRNVMKKNGKKTAQKPADAGKKAEDNK